MDKENEREAFERALPRAVKTRMGMDVYYTPNEYEAAWEGWQAACKWQRERDAEIVFTTFNNLDFEQDVQAQSGGSWTSHMIHDAILNQGSKDETKP